VLEESNIVSNIEFVETAAGTSSVIGQFVSATATKPYGTTGPGYGLSRESREVAIENGRRMIQQVAGQLHLNSHFVDAAHRLYILAVHHHFTQGRRTAHVVAACLYIVCRREKSPHLLIDFAEALQANLYTLGACFLKFTRLLMLNLPIIDPSLYIHRFALRMELGEATHTVSMTALRLVARMKRDWIQTGRRPAGICGACLLIASRVHGFRRTRQEVMHIVRVTDITLRNRLAEFENTPASLLSADEFEKLETLEEADPPSYVRGLLDEAFAREAALLEDAYNADTSDLRLENNSSSSTNVGYYDPTAINVSAGAVPIAAAKTLIERPAITMLMERSHILDAEIVVSNSNIGAKDGQLPAIADGSIDENNSRLIGDEDRTYDGGASVDGSRSYRGTKLSSRHSMVSDTGTDIPLATVNEISKAITSPLLTPEEQALWKAKTLLSKNWGSAVGKFRRLLAEREREALARQQQNKENVENQTEANNDEEADDQDNSSMDSDERDQTFRRRTRGNLVRGVNGKLLRRPSASSRRRQQANSENNSENEQSSEEEETERTPSRSSKKKETVKTTTSNGGNEGLDRRQQKTQLMYSELATDLAVNLRAGEDTQENMQAKSASIAAKLSLKAIETAQELLDRTKNGEPLSTKSQRKQKSSQATTTTRNDEDEEDEDNLAIVVHPTLGATVRTGLPSSDPELYEQSRKLLSRTIGNTKESSIANSQTSLLGPRYDVSDIATAEVIAAANKDFEMPELDEDEILVVDDDQEIEDIEENNKSKPKSRNSKASITNAPVDAEDVNFYVLSSTEATKRKEIWNSIYENYMKEREEKKKADSQVYRKLRPGSSRSSKGGATVTEAVGNLLSAPRLSKKLNYAAMQSLGNLFSDENEEGGNDINNSKSNMETTILSSARAGVNSARTETTTISSSKPETVKNSKRRVSYAETEDFEDEGTVASRPSTTKRSKVTETKPTTAKAPAVKVTAPAVKVTAPTVKATAPSVKVAAPTVKVTAPSGNITQPSTSISATKVPVPITKPGTKQAPPVVASTKATTTTTRSAIPITKPKAVNKKKYEETDNYDDNEEFVSESNKWGSSRRDNEDDGGQEDYD